MKKCLHCNEICNDNVSICPKCGAMVDDYIDHKKYMDVYHVNHGKKLKNKKIILWFLLGMVLPYIGFIVSWIIYDGERDKAKALLLGAIISTVAVSVLPYVLYFFSDNNGNNSEGNNGQQIKQLISIYKSL